MQLGGEAGALQVPAPRLILASASASRRTLLEAAGLTFTSIPAAIDEAAVKHAIRAEGGSARDAALALATRKARAITAPGAMVIGCDQILVCGDTWFDKPATLAEARAHLLALRGRAHCLVTACVCCRDGVLQWQHIAAPHLTMRAFSEPFLDAYFAAEGDAVLASVGAYRLEGLGMQLFDTIDGEHSAILGLPMLALLAFLRGEGLVVG